MLKQVMEILEVLDDPKVNGIKIVELFKDYENVKTEIETIGEKKGTTDVIRIIIKGEDPEAPVLGVFGQLGGIGARPEAIGYVSDGDGATSVLALALKVAQMNKRGDVLRGDLFISTHICPNAPTQPHDPVPFMGSPVGTREAIAAMKRNGNIDALISVDTTKGNRIINHKGISITSTVKKGYIMSVSDDLLDIYERVTGISPRVLPISMQDITPYGNKIYHINSIMQPCTQMEVPVVGLAITTEAPVAGCATGASHEIDIELSSRFCLEVAKQFSSGKCLFFDENQYNRLVHLYGDLSELSFSTKELIDE